VVQRRGGPPAPNPCSHQEDATWLAPERTEVQLLAIEDSEWSALHDWDSHPLVATEGSWTRDDRRELVTYAATMRVQIFALALLTACSGKSDPASGSAGKPRDCAGYAERFARLIDPDPSRRETALAGALSACEKGRVTDQQIQCIEDASSQDSARACMGLGPVTPEPPRAKAKTVVTIDGIEGGAVSPFAEMSQRQKEWRDQIASFLESCGRKAPPETRTAFDVVVTYGSGFRGKADGPNIPEQLRECVLDAVASAKPDSISRIEFNKPITFHMTAEKAP
jgi:hypothetical protein